MTEARTPMQNIPTLPKNKEERLGEALRKNLHRRKAQARSRAAGAANVDPVAPGSKGMQKKSPGESSNG